MFYYLIIINNNVTSASVLIIPNKGLTVLPWNEWKDFWDKLAVAEVSLSSDICHGSATPLIKPPQFYVCTTLLWEPLKDKTERSSPFACPSCDPLRTRLLHLPPVLTSILHGAQQAEVNYPKVNILKQRGADVAAFKSPVTAFHNEHFLIQPEAV